MKITIRNFQKKIPIHPKRIKETILKVLSSKKPEKSGEITVCFVSDAVIRKLNKKYHHSDSPTDVLTFDVSDPGARNDLSSDIIVSADTALRNAKIYKTSADFELNLYVVHGTLHILGFNDITVSQAKQMRKKESEYVHT